MGAPSGPGSIRSAHEAPTGLRPSGDDPSRKLRVLSLFAGIGGFDLGLERTGGFKTVAFCEIDPFCQRVLAKHWPEVPCYHDVRELTAAKLAADGIAVDVICGGFPCQDISDAGKKAGIDGERSGLWSEIARLASELRPGFIIVENVAALLSRGLARVLGDLAAIGYDAEWDCIPASAVGAPHRRDRVWILAHPSNGIGLHRAIERPCEDQGRGIIEARGCDVPSHVADAQRGGLQSGDVQRTRAEAIVAAAFGRYCGGGDFGSPWRIEPDVGRVAYGLPASMDRLHALGNAVVPQIPELIGRAILASGMSAFGRDGNRLGSEGPPARAEGDAQSEDIDHMQRSGL